MFLLVLFLIVLLIVLLLTYYIIYSEKTIHEMVYPEYYGNRFIEESFPPVKNKSHYYRRVAKGYKLLKNSKVAILGLAYNLDVRKMMKRLSFITKKCKDYRIIIYGVDSTDNSFKILEKYECDKIILPKKLINKEGLNRVQKMAKLRNILRKTLIKSDFNPDYVILQDCDLASALSIDGIAHSLTYMNEYSGIFANGLRNEFLFNFHSPYLGYYYYDSYALREDPQNPILYDTDFHKGIKVTMSICQARGQSLIPVKSAFGGAGIYKYQVFKDFKYKENTKRCEHVDFNEQIYDRGHKLAINPSLILLSGRQGEKFHKEFKD